MKTPFMFAAQPTVTCYNVTTLTKKEKAFAQTLGIASGFGDCDTCSPTFFGGCDDCD